MKKKGFTLVELLSIIVILGVIVTVVLPNIGGSVSKKKQNEYDRLVSIIENAAKSYHSSNKEITMVTIDTLIDENLLTTGLTDMDGEPIAGCVRISKNLEGFNEYKYYKNCTLETVNLVVNLNGGTTSQTFNATYQEAERLVLQEPTKSGDEFFGWRVVRGNSILNGNNLIFGNTDTEIYAIWQSNLRLTVNANGGTLSQTFAPSYLSGTIINLGTASKAGYTFNGWIITEGDSVLSGNTLTMGTTNTVVDAQYTPNTYTIVLINSNATTNGSTSTTATYNGGLTSITSPQRVHTITYSAGSTGATLSKTSDTVTYTFNGWYTATTGGTKVINADGTLVSNVTGYTDSNGNWIKTSGETLYAQWSGESVITAAITKTGYTCNFGAVGSEASYTPTSTITLTAECQPNTYACSSGQYLKAGEMTCSACIAGSYCPGGNLQYDETNDNGITPCAAGYYSAASAASCTACAKGSYASGTGNTGCTACQPSGAAGANGTTSGVGQSSCNASCGKSNVSTWKTASWSSNSVSNSCTINACASGYTLSSNACNVSYTCWVPYAGAKCYTSATTGSSTQLSGLRNDNLLKGNSYNGTWNKIVSYTSAGSNNWNSVTCYIQKSDIKSTDSDCKQ